jgi:Domain of unknown function (DUF4342)
MKSATPVNPDPGVAEDAPAATTAPIDESVPVAENAPTENAHTENAHTENAHTENASSEPVSSEPVSREEFRIRGDELVTQVKALIHEGNIRRIIVKNETGHTLIEIPLTVGVVGGVLSAALFPVLAAVGAIGAVVAHLTLVIEKRD